MYVLLPLQYGKSIASSIRSILLHKMGDVLLQKSQKGKRGIEMAKVTELAKKYAALFGKFDAERPDQDFETGGLFYDDEEENVILPFVKLLTEKVQNLEAEGKTEAAQRTIGFIQGILFGIGEFSLRELREHLENPSLVPLAGDRFDDEDNERS